ncbi:hypothetical protein R3P38DRAFT_2700885 [Favolaschia claudopus]|uniref:Alkyl hydroperoxide reductase subunit C/ Thiol specific antioxidant domain-containing protein n=1 Tax=Favolaschia claudopus TaxID=2862362 RepID=A0AAW0C3N9_9AGAR
MSFGVLLRGEKTRRSIVVFLRHFWCPLCQDYVTALAKGVHDALHLLIVAPGPHTLAARYLASFGFDSTLDKGVASVRLFVDPCPAEGVYAALGMGWMTATEEFHHEHGHDDHVDDPHAAPETYVTHGTVSGIGAVALRTLRAGLVPAVWERGGDVRLLGGEFVFETSSVPELTSSLRCIYAHRMQTPRGHASVARIFSAAGVRLPLPVSDATSGSTSRFALPRSLSATVTPALAAAPSSVQFSTSLPSSTSTPSVRTSSISSSAHAATGNYSAFTFARLSLGAHGHGQRGRRGVVGKGDVEERGVAGEEEGKKEEVNSTNDFGHGHAQISTSVSTPMAREREHRDRHTHGWGWAHLPHWRVGVIWESEDAETAEAGEFEEADGEKEGGRKRERQPAIPLTLSASSSRPWALAGSRDGSSSSSSLLLLSEKPEGTTSEPPVLLTLTMAKDVGGGSETSASASTSSGSDGEPDSESASSSSMAFDDAAKEESEEHKSLAVFTFPRRTGLSGHTRAKSLKVPSAEQERGVHVRTYSERSVASRRVKGDTGLETGCRVDGGEAVWMRRTASERSLWWFKAKKAVRRG